MNIIEKTFMRCRALFYRTKYRFVKERVIRFKILSERETLDVIISKRASISRIGEGEFRWMIGESYNSFQVYDSKMRDRLLETLHSNLDNLLIAITPVLSDEKYMGDTKYWKYILGKEGIKWSKLLEPSRTYYNQNITRFYMEYKDSAFAKEMISGLKRIWDKQDIIVVEGELTRFGVGNDLLDNANEIKRIIAPSENAFSKYDEIFDSIIKHNNGGPVIMALGPTASILAYDLTLKGIWAIDIGHADIEYEWFMAGAKEKQPVKGKYVNEAGGMDTFIEFEPEILEKYKSQIVDYVK